MAGACLILLKAPWLEELVYGDVGVLIFSSRGLCCKRGIVVKGAVP